MTEATDQTPEKPTTDDQRKEIARGWLTTTDSTTVEAYCKQKGISPASLYGWIKKFGLNPDAKTRGKTAKPTVKAPTTIEDMEAEIERQEEALEKQKADYIKLLDSEVVRLRAELSKAEQKYEKHTGKKYPLIAQSPGDAYAQFTREAEEEAELEKLTKPSV